MRRAARLLLLLGLAGCVHLAQPAPRIQSYRLDYARPGDDHPPLPAIIEVSAFRVNATYDRDAMVYRSGGHATGTYFYQRWSANPGSMISDLLARDLADSGAYRAVQQGLSLLPADYQLGGTVEEIEERVRAGHCAAHLRVRVLLVRARPGHGDPVRLQHTYAGEQPCTCNAPASLAAAMSQVLQHISADVQRDVYAAVAADHA